MTDKISAAIAAFDAIKPSSSTITENLAALKPENVEIEVTTNFDGSPANVVVTETTDEFVRKSYFRATSSVTDGLKYEFVEDQILEAPIFLDSFFSDGSNTPEAASIKNNPSYHSLDINKYNSWILRNYFSKNTDLTDAVRDRRLSSLSATSPSNALFALHVYQDYLVGYINGSITDTNTIRVLSLTLTNWTADMWKEIPWAESYLTNQYVQVALKKFITTNLSHEAFSKLSAADQSLTLASVQDFGKTGAILHDKINRVYPEYCAAPDGFVGENALSNSRGIAISRTQDDVCDEYTYQEYLANYTWPQSDLILPPTSTNEGETLVAAAIEPAMRAIPGILERNPELAVQFIGIAERTIRDPNVLNALQKCVDDFVLHFNLRDGSITSEDGTVYQIPSPEAKTQLESMIRAALTEAMGKVGTEANPFIHEMLDELVPNITRDVIRFARPVIRTEMPGLMADGLRAARSPGVVAEAKETIKVYTSVFVALLQDTDFKNDIKQGVISSLNIIDEFKDDPEIKAQVTALTDELASDLAREFPAFYEKHHTEFATLVGTLGLSFSAEALALDTPEGIQARESLAKATVALVMMGQGDMMAALNNDPMLGEMIGSLQNSIGVIEKLEKYLDQEVKVRSQQPPQAGIYGDRTKAFMGTFLDSKGDWWQEPNEITKKGSSLGDNEYNIKTYLPSDGAIKGLRSFLQEGSIGVIASTMKLPDGISNELAVEAFTAYPLHEIRTYYYNDKNEVIVPSEKYFYNHDGDIVNPAGEEFSISGDTLKNSSGTVVASGLKQLTIGLTPIAIDTVLFGSNNQLLYGEDPSGRYGSAPTVADNPGTPDNETLFSAMQYLNILGVRKIPHVLNLRPTRDDSKFFMLTWEMAPKETITADIAYMGTHPGKPNVHNNGAWVLDKVNGEFSYMLVASESNAAVALAPGMLAQNSADMADFMRAYKALKDNPDLYRAILASVPFADKGKHGMLDEK